MWITCFYDRYATFFSTLHNFKKQACGPPRWLWDVVINSLWVGFTAPNFPVSSDQAMGEALLVTDNPLVLLPSPCPHPRNCNPSSQLYKAAQVRDPDLYPCKLFLPAFCSKAVLTCLLPASWPAIRGLTQYLKHSLVQSFHRKRNQGTGARLNAQTQKAGCRLPTGSRLPLPQIGSRIWVLTNHRNSRPPGGR